MTVSRPVNFIFLIRIFFGAILLFSCTQPARETKRGIQFSRQVDSLIALKDSVSPVIDSLRILIQSEKKKTIQIDLLNELAHNWRGITQKILADEALRQSQKMNYKQGMAEAIRQQGIYYYRHSIQDSAQLKFDEGIAFCNKNNLPGIKGKIHAWKGESYRIHNELDLALKNYETGLSFSTSLPEKEGLMLKTDCYAGIGEVYRMKANFGKAEYYYNQALFMALQNKDDNNAAFCLSALGSLYMQEGIFSKSLQKYKEAIKFAQKTGNYNEIGFCLNNIGSIYSEQNNYRKALQYFHSGMIAARKVNDATQIAYTLQTMGSLYLSLEKPDSARMCFTRSKKIFTEINDVTNFAVSLKGIAFVNLLENKIDDAIIKLDSAIHILDTMDYVVELSYAYIGKSDALMRQNKLAESARMADSSYKYAQLTSMPVVMKEASNQRFLVYEKLGNLTEALKMHVEFTKMNDSINIRENSREIAEIEFKTREEKVKADQEKKDMIAKEEKMKDEQKLERQKYISFILTIIGVVVLILLFIFYRSNRIRKKTNLLIVSQKEKVESQKKLIEEKAVELAHRQKEIVDSITYAKRLQSAILASPVKIQDALNNSFLLYKPKDIVAGDFYFFEKVGNNIFIAAADCTGHGVPGAMVSVVCANALTRCVKEFNLTDPGQILDKTRELVLETFGKSNENINDGMDISLAVINGNHLKWSGANNPLWYFHQQQMKEIAADKQSIGKTENPQRFKTHTVELQKNDSVYLFTDGFADQFGGPKGKKFKYAELKQLLVSAENEDQDMKIVGRKLEQSFYNWKGNAEQTDDVCIIGIKI